MSESNWMGDVGQGAAKLASLGAALGSVVPGIGTVIGSAAGAVGGGVVGLMANLFPETVGAVLNGPQAARAAPLIAQAVQEVTGATTPDAVMTALAADPAKEIEIRAKLADVWVQMDRIASEDRKDARAQTLQLAQAGSPIAWGAPSVSLVLLAMFGAALALVLLRGIPQGAQEIGLLLLGGLAGMASQVANYWLGSSAGSARKTNLLAANRQGPEPQS